MSLPVPSDQVASFGNTSAVGRYPTIDLLRGLVMVLMTIDHAREYQAGPGRGLVSDPMDLDVVTPGLFFLRWISHFCAPVFALLMGCSVWASSGKRDTQTLSRHLLQRGFVLLILEATIINWCWTFNPFWPRYFFQVIAALGFGLLALAGAVRFPHRVAMAAGAAIVLGHNLLDGISFAESSWQHYVWSVIHQKNVLPLAGGFEFRTTYPVLPVIGVALCGFGLGPWLSTEPGRKRLLWLGASAMVVFLLLRLTNWYGDPSPFVYVPGDPLRTLLSLGNVTKYPLSLQFILMTTGPALVALALGRWRVPAIELLGRVPMLYYVLHLAALHILVWAYAWLLGYRWTDFDLQRNFGGVPTGVGFPLWVTVPFALATVALLWPACKWYDRVRPRHRWLSYF